MPRTWIWVIFMWFAMWFAPAALAGDGDAIAPILALAEPPPGVVFEIAGADDDGLVWAIAAVTRYARRLRLRFPALPLAVVSHGREQFALTRDNSRHYAPVHAAVRTLVQQNVPVQVCGTFARWNGVSETAFPAYVEVVPAAPETLAHYIELGYVPVRLIPPSR